MGAKILMIIGGGPLQVPLIKQAGAMGLSTVVTDLRPDAPGFALADYQIEISTRDIDGTVRLAREFHQKNPVSGVMTAGTDASMTVAAVAAMLDLPGIKFVDAEAASNKIKMRQRFAEKGVPSPRFFPAWSVSEARTAAAELGYPLVIKPADNMGARGVIKVNHSEEVDKAYRHARQNSPTGAVLVEEYMSGPELSVDALAWDGQIRLTGIADRIIEREPYFVETGHTMPSSLPPKILSEAEEVMRQGMRALGITRGAGKGDLKVTPHGVKIGELAARLSGGYMSSHTYPLATGVNLLRAAIEIALGGAPTSLEPEVDRVCIERAIIPPPGKILEMEGFEDARGLTGVEEVFVHYRTGETIPAVTSNIGKLANIIITADSLNEAENTFERVKQTVRVRVDDIEGLDQQQIIRNARARFAKNICWLCKTCDGENCASGVPGMGGLGNMTSFANNGRALKQISIRPAYLHPPVEPNTHWNFFGLDLCSPLGAAPITGAVTNLGGAVKDELEYNRLICQSLAEEGALPVVGDGASPEKYKIGLQALTEIGGQGAIIFKPRADLEQLRLRLAAAEKAGVRAVGIDIDAIFFKTLQNKNQATRAYGEEGLKKIRAMTRLPFLLKGIMNEADALLAAKLSFDGIIVSNHGGRVLDDMPGTATVLPGIARCVREVHPDFPVFADGGIRSGEDAFKMLGLGARAVFVGRPYCINAVGGGSAGVKLLHREYKAGLERAMRLCGLESLAEVTRRGGEFLG